MWREHYENKERTPKGATKQIIFNIITKEVCESEVHVLIKIECNRKCFDVNVRDIMILQGTQNNLKVL